MKRFAMALALMCALSTSIFAGNMPTGGKSENHRRQQQRRTTHRARCSLSVILTMLGLR